MAKSIFTKVKELFYANPYDVTPNQSTIVKEKKTKDRIPAVASGFYPGGYRQNPDPNLQQKGRDRYKKSAADDTVSAISRIWNELIWADDWYVEPVSDDPMDIEKAKFHEEYLRSIPMPLVDEATGESVTDIGLDHSIQVPMTNMQIDSWHYGFKVAEIDYNVRALSPIEYPLISGLPKMALSSFKPRYGDYIIFNTNKYGSLVAMKSLLGNDELKVTDDYFRNNILLMINRFSDGNFYGESILREIDREIFAKEQITKFLNIFTEYRAMGVWKITYKKTLRKTKDYEDMKAMAATLYQNASAVLPKSQDKEGNWEPDFDLDLLQMSSQGAQVFQNAIEMYDTRIKRHLGFPDKMGFTESSGGSYALGKGQIQDIAFTIVRHYQNDVEDIVSNQIIKRVHKMNWNDDIFPKMKFKTKEDKEAKADRYIKLINARIMSPDEKVIRKDLDLPAKEEPAMTPTLPNPEIPIGQQVSQNTPQQPQFFAVIKGKSLKDRTDNDARKKEMDGIESDFRKEVIPDIAEEKSALLKRINASGIFQTKDTGVIKDIKINVGGIKAGLNTAQLRSYFASKAMFSKEAKKAGVDIVEKYNRDKIQTFAILPTKKYKEQMLGKYHKFAYTTDAFAETQEMIEEWLKKYGLNLSPSDLAAIKTISDQSFFLAGKVGDEIANDIKKILIDRIALDPASVLVTKLSAVFDSYQPTGSIAGGSPEPYRLDTMIRTYTTKQFNAGRDNMATDPDLGGLVRACVYNATIDEATTEYCYKHDGQVMLISNPLFPQTAPPAHYGCRSTRDFMFDFEDIPKEDWTKFPARAVGW